MNILTFLLETDTFDDGNPEEMAKILTDAGVRWSYVKYVPIASQFEYVKPSSRYHKLYKHYVKHDFDPGNYDGNYAVVFYGSLNAAKLIHRQYSHWLPGVWCDFPTLSCKHYFVHYGKHLISQQYAFMPVSEIFRKKDEIFSTFGKDGHVFVRPDENDKCFNGELVCPEKWEEWQDQNVNFYDKNPYKLAVVAKPSKIEQEWRLVIKNGEVITGSQYRKIVDGRSSVEWEVGYTDEVKAYTEGIIKEAGWTPHPIFVMDIALTEHGLGLVELGSVNTCGMYSCDLKKVVDAMIEVASVNL